MLNLVVDEWILETTQPHKHVTNFLSVAYHFIFTLLLNWKVNFFKVEKLISVWTSGYLK